MRLARRRCRRLRAAARNPATATASASDERAQLCRPWRDPGRLAGASFTLFSLSFFFSPPAGARRRVAFSLRRVSFLGDGCVTRTVPPPPRAAGVRRVHLRHARPRRGGLPPRRHVPRSAPVVVRRRLLARVDRLREPRPPRQPARARRRGPLHLVRPPPRAGRDAAQRATQGGKGRSRRRS